MNATPSANSPPQDADKALSVGIVPLSRFTLNAFASFVDAFRLAADERDRSRPIRCRWEVMSEHGRPVPASCGVSVSATAAFLPPKQFDYIAVVGGLLGHDTAREAAIVAYLKESAEAGVPVIGICTGVFAMVRAGLMKGRRCCVSWLHYRELLETTEEVIPDSSRLFVVDGQRLTCAGGIGSARLAAWLIEKHIDRAAAEKALGIMMVGGERNLAAQPQPALGVHVTDPRVARAVLMLEEDLADPPSIDYLAEAVSISRRQLERGFREQLGMSYGDFSRAVRLDHGLWLVMTSDRSILDITMECGFNGQSHFATLFRKNFGLSPSEARALDPEEREALLTDQLRFRPREMIVDRAPG